MTRKEEVVWNSDMEAIEDFREEGHNGTARNCRKYFLRNNITIHKLIPSPPDIERYNLAECISISYIAGGGTSRIWVPL